MAFRPQQAALICVISIVLLARPAYAFGAGNIASISKIEGQNWRHGDIEDVLLGIAASKALGRKFGKLDVKRVYFGNWLRDYSQAVDVGTVKYVSAKAITLILWVLGFMSFGYGTGEFEVTMERLGCYRPEEHIDNPKDYADNEDARNYDRRLRGPVDERRELSIDHETGMKNYIASENVGITTSAGLVRNLFGRCIQLGRQYNRRQNKADLYEALRLLGTGCHCLEDFSAHSNYVELALIEMGERDVFAHVGRNTQIQLRGARERVWPLITGTFGGVDFLHSVTGEFDDKVTQSEIQELENTMQAAQNQQENKSVLQELLKKIPDGIFGDKDEANKADQLKQDAVAHQMSNTHISPRNPEEWLQYIETVRQQIYPILQYHDEIMQSITEMVEKIPIIPDLLDKLSEELNVFVFSLLAPYVLPIIQQVKSELNTGSNAIIESSEAAQHIVFRDDNSSDPTHSMLSKDHFSNILNEPAGKVAGQVLKWAVPQIMAAWDDESIDVDRTINRIIRGVLHHPAMRQSGDDGAIDGRRLMFGVVENWWREKSDREKDGLREQLSRRGVETGRNHKPGVVDHGHGSCKPLSMPGFGTASSSGAPGGALGQILGSVSGGSQSQFSNQAGKMAAEAVGGGVLGGLVGGLVSGVGGDILGGGLNENKQTQHRQDYGRDGSRTETYTQSGHAGGTYGQAQYSRTENQSGGHTEQYSRYETTSSGTKYQSEYHHEERSSGQTFQQEGRQYSQGNSRDSDSYRRNRESERHDRKGSHERKTSRERRSSRERQGSRERKNSRERKGSRERKKYDSDSSDGDRRKKTSKEKRHSGQRDDDGSYNTGTYGSERASEYGSSGRYGAQTEHGQREDYGGRQQTYGSDNYNRQSQETSNYGRQATESYGRRDDNSSYGGNYDNRQGQQHGGYDRPQQDFGGGYEQRQEQSYGGGFEQRQEQSYGQREDQSYGGGGGGGGYQEQRRSDYEEPGQGFGGGYGRGNDDEDNDQYGRRRDNQYGGY